MTSVIKTCFLWFLILSKKIMRNLFLLITVGIGLGMISCKREPAYDQDNDMDPIITVDSTTSGTYQVSPDSLDETLPIDSSDYDVDSIENMK